MAPGLSKMFLLRMCKLYTYCIIKEFKACIVLLKTSVFIKSLCIYANVCMGSQQKCGIHRTDDPDPFFSS